MDSRERVGVPMSANPTTPTEREALYPCCPYCGVAGTHASDCAAPTEREVLRKKLEMKLRAFHYDPYASSESVAGEIHALYTAVLAPAQFRSQTVVFDASTPAAAPRCGCSDTPMELVWECPQCGNQTEEGLPSAPAQEDECSCFDEGYAGECPVCADKYRATPAQSEREVDPDEYPSHRAMRALRERDLTPQEGEREWDAAMWAMQRVIEQRDEARAEITALMDSLEAAWGIIANASSGDWGAQDEMWVDAAERWRDFDWHPALDRNGYPCRATSPRPAPEYVEELNDQLESDRMDEAQELERARERPMRDLAQEILDHVARMGDDELISWPHLAAIDLARAYLATSSCEEVQPPEWDTAEPSGEADPDEYPSHRAMRALRAAAEPSAAQSEGECNLAEWVLMYNDALGEGEDADAVFHDMVRVALEIRRPGHTDLMVSPEAIDEMLDAAAEPSDLPTNSPIGKQVGKSSTALREAVIRRVLAAGEALIERDIGEAYHQLYELLARDLGFPELPGGPFDAAARLLHADARKGA
jgi:hypothetical protein